MPARTASRDGPDPIDLAVGARVRVRRQMQGVSQQQLAESLGVTFQQVQKYEKGANRISASMLVRAADVLETTVASLVGEDASAHADPVLLATPGAVKLLQAYVSLESPAVQASLLRLTRELAASPAGVEASAAKA